MSSNEAAGRAVAWQAFVRMQAILTYPHHTHWGEQAWAEYAHHISNGFRDLFTLTEQERGEAENLFFNTIIRLQEVEQGTQIRLN
ncbi:MAG TPA: hypothetical protein VKT82_01695 [Ktedonobacterales bacterium]|nr:hypothetical protein [Ktedonobacterales bacterium]